MTTIYIYWVNAAHIPMRIRTDISPVSFQKEMWLFLNCPPQFLLPFLHLDASFEHLGFWPVLWCNLVSGQDHGKVRKKQCGHRDLALVCTSTVLQRTVWSIPLHTWFLHTRHKQFLQQCLSPLLPLCLRFSVHCGLCQYIFSRVTAPSSLLCCDSPHFWWTRSLKLESFHPLPF